MHQNARQSAYQSAFAAALMLFYGWYIGWTGISSDDTYNLAVEVFKWNLKLGGAAMLVVAIVCFLGQRIGLLLDCLVSGACGIIMAACALIWLTRGRGFDIQDAIVLAFGFVFVRAAWVSWTLFAGPQTSTTVAAPPAPEPIHPASIHPESLPMEHEPPPPDGFLAAMAKEKDEPPTASYE